MSQWRFGKRWLAYFPHSGSSPSYMFWNAPNPNSNSYSTYFFSITSAQPTTTTTTTSSPTVLLPSTSIFTRSSATIITATTPVISNTRTGVVTTPTCNSSSKFTSLGIGQNAVARFLYFGLIHSITWFCWTIRPPYAFMLDRGIRLSTDLLFRWYNIIIII